MFVWPIYGLQSGYTAKARASKSSELSFVLVSKLIDFDTYTGSIRAIPNLIGPLIHAGVMKRRAFSHGEDDL